jgi:hypothetical protein
MGKLSSLEEVTSPVAGGLDVTPKPRLLSPKKAAVLQLLGRASLARW